MLDVLLATIAFTAVFAIGLAGLFVVTALPFAWTLQLAERRRLPSGRWGMYAAAGIGFGLLAAAAIYRAEGPPDVYAVIALPLTYAGPLAAYLTDERKDRSARVGRHQ